MIGYWNWANALTLLGAFFGFCTGWIPLTEGLGNLTPKTAFLLGMICLILAGICDLFDGFVARRLKLSEAEKAFGIQLDSLVDLLSFGVGPVCLFLDYFLTPELAGTLSPIQGMMGSLILALYLGAVLIRLAYFNVHGLQAGENQTAYYTGLPVTYVALVFPVGHLFFEALPFPLLELGLFFALTGLYLSRLAIPKPSGKAYLFFPLLAAVTLGMYTYLLQLAK